MILNNKNHKVKHISFMFYLTINDVEYGCINKPNIFQNAR